MHKMSLSVHKNIIQKVTKDRKNDSEAAKWINAGTKNRERTNDNNMNNNALPLHCHSRRLRNTSLSSNEHIVMFLAGVYQTFRTTRKDTR
jgi:hypothetical protein